MSRGCELLLATADEVANQSDKTAYQRQTRQGGEDVPAHSVGLTSNSVMSSS